MAATANVGAQMFAIGQQPPTARPAATMLANVGQQPAIVPGQKSPLLIFNERFPGYSAQIQFEENRLPIGISGFTTEFKATLKISEQSYSNVGTSKKLAKSNLVIQILSSGIQLPSLAHLAPSMAPGSQKRKFKHDNSNHDEMIAKKRRLLIEKLDRSNTVQIFNELCSVVHGAKPVVHFEIVSPPGTKPNEIMFACTISYGGKTFRKEGYSKKLLKLQTVEMALKEIFDIDVVNNVSPKEEIMQLLATSGKNFRNVLNLYATRHALSFKVHCDEIEAGEDSTFPGLKLKAHKVVCTLGDETFTQQSSLSKQDCLNTVFLAMIAKICNSEVEQIKMEMHNLQAFCHGDTVVQMDTERSPVQLLNELAAKNNLTITFTDLDDAERTSRNLASSVDNLKKLYHVKVCFNGKEFLGTANNKKQAKREAALSLLKEVFPSDYEMHLSDAGTNKDLFGASASKLKKGSFEFSLKQKFIAAALSDQPDRLLAANVAFHSKCSFAQVLQEFNVIPSSTFAAFLLRDDQRGEQEFTVVSLASGSSRTTAVTGINGEALNDNHSAVLARRGLQAFLYDQLQLLFTSQHESSVLEVTHVVKKEEAAGVAPYRLKSRYSLHFYDSRVPPGDASSDPYDASYKNSLRCYKADGISTVPLPHLEKMVKNEATFGDMNTFEPKTRSMSLSDKILKWNVLGVQGALLSIYIEPIYLESIVFGQTFCKNIAQKALFGRIDTLMWNNEIKLNEPASQCFKPHSPKVLSFEYVPSDVNKFGKGPKMVSGGFDDSKLNSPTDYALTWYDGALPPVEFVMQHTGRELQGGRSPRLSKQAMFERFIKIFQQKPIIDNKSLVNRYYLAKQRSSGYENVKTKFVNLLKSSGYGTWIQNKSKLVDDFDLPWIN